MAEDLMTFGNDREQLARSMFPRMEATTDTTDKPTKDETKTAAPFRSLDEFVLNSNLYRLPKKGQFGAWAMQFYGNILYFQTNYFLVFFAILAVVGLTHPVHLVVGVLMHAGVASAFDFAFKREVETQNFARRYPGLVLTLKLLTGCVLHCVFGTLPVALSVTVLPLSVILVHASLRTREYTSKHDYEVMVQDYKCTYVASFVDAILECFDVCPDKKSK